MSNVTIELERTLNELDGQSATALERLVRDAIALAQPAKANGSASMGKKGWPAGYFDKTAGSFAGEPFDVPSDPPPDRTAQW